MSTINQYKSKAGRIVDSAMKGTLDKTGAYLVAASILSGKLTKGYKAALLTGLVVGAIIERGKPDFAVLVLEHIANLIDENKG